MSSIRIPEKRGFESIYVLNSVGDLLIVVLRVLLNVALVTLLERKALSISQLRVGPNKVGSYGVLQPAADAIKLFSNGLTILGPINRFIFIMSPVIAIVLMIILSSLVRFTSGSVVARYSVFLLLIILSLNVYPVLGSG